MIKVDIVNEVSRLADITKVKAEVAVDAVFDAMRASMMRGERIELRGFGVFQVKPRKRGIGRNPRTGKEVPHPSRPDDPVQARQGTAEHRRAYGVSSEQLPPPPQSPAEVVPVEDAAHRVGRALATRGAAARARPVPAQLQAPHRALPADALHDDVQRRSSSTCTCGWAARCRPGRIRSRCSSTRSSSSAGSAFSLPLLIILSAHEFGHYVACRIHNVDATLPYLPAGAAASNRHARRGDSDQGGVPVQAGAVRHRRRRADCRLRGAPPVPLLGRHAVDRRAGPRTGRTCSISASRCSSRRSRGCTSA